MSQHHEVVCSKTLAYAPPPLGSCSALGEDDMSVSEPHDWDPRKIKQVCDDKHANAADEE
ncbi:hypothetical protein H2202_006678 [Exophiala xenobiotica]|nr:hypothetical protein H2202_006678 [Exophiala xenobiotica]